MDFPIRFWSKILLLAVFLVLLTFYLSFPVKVKKGEKDNLKQKYPYIDYPISCKGASEEEYSKRKEHSAGYFEPEIYIDSYLNKWDKTISNQKFNALSESNINANWTQKYPDNKRKTRLKAYTLPSESLLRNFMEEVDIRANEFYVHGRGYFFIDNGSVITLTSKYLFTERAAKSTGECFDNKKRILNINTEGYGFRGSSGQISWDLAFSVLTPQYCSLYSFLETSEDIFLVCLSEKVSPNKFKVLILAYSEGQTGNENNSLDNLTTFTPVLQEIITENYKVESFPYFNSNYLTILQNAKGHYYIFLGTKVYGIKPDEDGYLKMNRIDIPYSGGWINVLYPNKHSTQTYNLPYIFLAYKVSEDNKKGLLFDLSKGKFLDIDYESCVVKSPDNFYNRTIDPFLGGPYKSMGYEVISPNHIRVSQSVLNAGCVTNEGQIDVYIEDETVRCDVRIIGESLGC